MKKTVIPIFLIMMLAFSAVLASCSQPPKRKLLEIQPFAKEESVTSTDYRFTKDDFEVYAIYDDGTDELTTDYEFSVLGLKNGYYTIEFTMEDQKNYCYVMCDIDIYSK
ncbi:MAG: hypothetical protein IJU57_01820 [Clostridia bacterium]|nr:hypothetical protein [Clostridia bacterium]